LGEIYRDVSSRDFVYWKDMWNYYEWLAISIFAIVVALRLTTLGKMGRIDLDPAADTYVNMYGISRYVETEIDLMALFTIMAFMRSLKLLKLPPYTGPAAVSILDTIQDKSFVVFTIVVALVTIALSVAYHTAFGMYVEGVRDFPSTLITLIRAVLSDFDETSIGGKSYGVILFLLMKLFAATLLLTLFIAVLSDIYIALQAVNSERWEIFISSLLIENLIKNGPTAKQAHWGRKIKNMFGGMFSKVMKKSRKQEEELSLQHSPSVDAMDDDEALHEDEEGVSDVLVSWEDDELNDLVLSSREIRLETNNLMFTKVIGVQDRLETMEKELFDQMKAQHQVLLQKIHNIQSELHSPDEGGAAH